jgi:hypothetical protein
MDGFIALGIGSGICYGISKYSNEIYGIQRAIPSFSNTGYNRYLKKKIP